MIVSRNWLIILSVIPNNIMNDLYPDMYLLLRLFYAVFFGFIVFICCSKPKDITPIE